MSFIYNSFFKLYQRLTEGHILPRRLWRGLWVDSGDHSTQKGSIYFI